MSIQSDRGGYMTARVSSMALMLTGYFFNPLAGICLFAQAGMWFFIGQNSFYGHRPDLGIVTENNIRHNARCMFGSVPLYVYCGFLTLCLNHPIIGLPLGVLIITSTRQPLLIPALLLALPGAVLKTRIIIWFTTVLLYACWAYGVFLPGWYFDRWIAWLLYWLEAYAWTLNF